MDDEKKWDEILPAGTFITEEGALSLATQGTKIQIECAQSARAGAGGTVTGLWFVKIWFAVSDDAGTWLTVSKFKRNSRKGYKSGYGILTLCLRFGVSEANIPMVEGRASNAMETSSK